MFEYGKFKDLLNRFEKIVILPHTSPDGDALGSCFALCLILRKIFKDKEINVVSPDPIENYLLWTKEFMKDVVVWGSARSLELVGDADLFIHLDHNERSRLRHKDFIDALSGRPSVVIDHHLGGVFDSDVAFSNSGASSTCEIVFDIIKGCDWLPFIDSDISTMVLTGIITDTGRFLYGCNSDTFGIVSQLVSLGADMRYINDQLNYHQAENRIRLQSFIINDRMDIYRDLNLAIITITKEDLQRFSSSKGDTEGVVNVPLEIDGINISCMLREDADFIKLSFRSIGDYSVNDVAKKFGGGGHLNAAGGEFFGNMTDAKNKLIEVIKTKK